MSADLANLIPELQPFARQLVDAAGAARLLPRITSTLRTRTQQTRLYRDYLRGGRGYPVAAPGTSPHEYGYAFDMVVSPMDALWDVAQYWQQLGGVWRASDAIHFEYPGFHQDLASGQLSRPGAGLQERIIGEAAGFIIPELGGAQAVGEFIPSLDIGLGAPPISAVTATTDLGAYLAEEFLGLFK